MLLWPVNAMRRPFLACLLLPALVAACPAADDSDDDTGAMVVGVQADDLGAVVAAARLQAKVDGAVVKDEIVTALPAELELAGRAGARVEVIVDGFSSATAATAARTAAGSPGSPGSGPPIVSRRAAVAMPPKTKKLLRLQLEARCAGMSPGGGGGLVLPITCAEPQTCRAGQCTTSEVSSAELEDYAAGWPGAPPDACRPANHGPPELFLGTGMTNYAPLADGQTVMLEKGPQGGHHVWIAVRMKNLRRSGSRTAITARLPDDPGAAILPAGYVFAFETDEGGYCKLWGLRFQVDSGASDLAQAYKRFLGQRLEITVEVVDTVGGRASATKTIRIDDKLLCPDGTTTTCNGP